MKLRPHQAAAAVAVLALGVVLTSQTWRAQASDPAPERSASAPASAAKRATRTSGSPLFVRPVPRSELLAARDASAPPSFDPPDEPQTKGTRDLAASARAGRMAGAWTQVRKVLENSPELEDQLLAEEVYTLVLASREQRRAPDPRAWDELLDTMDELAERIEARGHEGSAEGLERARALAQL